MGDVLTGSGITTGTYITANVSGNGTTGTYLVNNAQTISAETITVLAGIETKWYAMSVGAAGELIKMSDHAIG